MAKRRRRAGGRVVAFPKTRREKWRTGGFDPTPEGGTPTFTLDGEQCSEFGVDARQLAVLCTLLVERRSWFMAIPPESGDSTYMLLVQYAEADFVMKFLDSLGGLYINRGLQNP